MKGLGWVNVGEHIPGLHGIWRWMVWRLSIAVANCQHAACGESDIRRTREQDQNKPLQSTRLSRVPIVATCMAWRLMEGVDGSKPLVRFEDDPYRTTLPDLRANGSMLHR